MKCSSPLPAALLLAACGPAEIAVGPGETTTSVETVPVEEIGGTVTWTACEGTPQVVLNELLASNAQGLADEDGEEADWLELRENAGRAVNLEGWSLSEDGAPKWYFPATPLTSGETLLVFATGKDRLGPSLHTNFALSSDAATLFLHAPDGCVADHVDAGRLYADESFGRSPSEEGGEDDAWEYFLEPTPGATNTTESRPGFSEKPALSLPGGLYDYDVQVDLTIPEGTVVRYSLDGSVPAADAPAVEGPIDVEAGETPVVLRARSFQDGLWPSRIATATYSEDPSLLGNGVMVMSLTVDPPDLWDTDRGIYVTGDDYEAWYPYFGANFWEQWERDLHLEMWAADGTPMLDQDAGIQIAGGYSRAFDQRNFELLARSGYGEDTFAASVFHQEDMTEYHRLYLRNGGDWCGTQIVDASVQALLRDPSGVRYPSVDAQAYEPVLVYLNGSFWGLYELKERLDEWYVEAHHGEDPELLDRVKVGWTHEANWELEQGDWEAFDALEALVAEEDFSDPSAWADFTARVDVENLAMTVLAQGWIGNSDWWGNNLRLWRPHTDPLAQVQGRWRWMVYDFGHGWTNWNYDHLGTSVGTSSKGLPIADALENEAFRNLLINAHGDLLNTTMHGDYAAATVRALAEETRPVMGKQRERWCGGASLDTWTAAVDYAVEFAQNRATAMDRQVLDHLAPGGHAHLDLDAEPRDGGTFRLSFVEVSAPFSGDYYQDVPVTVTAVPAEGQAFLGWSDASLGTAETVVLPMGEGTSVTAYFEAGP